MKRILLAVSSLSFLAMGCGVAAVPPRVTLAKTTPVKVAMSLPVEQAPTVLSERAPGHYVTYKFSGSYRDNPVTLTQLVVDRTIDLLVVDVTIDDGEAHHRLRLRVSEAGELISVAKLEGNVQLPFGVLAYEQLMNDIVLTADDNSGAIDSIETIREVAGETLAVTLTNYKVHVGLHEAVMQTVVAPGFVWGDVGGEIRSLDGVLMYKAEIVDLGADNDSVAVYEDDDFYDDYDHFEE
jgi:hypothetical protein